MGWGGKSTVHKELLRVTLDVLRSLWVVGYFRLLSVGESILLKIVRDDIFYMMLLTWPSNYSNETFPAGFL